MNEAQVFFLGTAYGQLLAGGVGAPPGGSGEDPNRPLRPMSSHEADAIPAVVQQRKKKAPSRNRSRNESGDGPHPCPVCDRRFDCPKAVYGHQRSHPERAWRGMAPPAELPVVAVTADGRQLRYACERCGAQFETRQALGGHRASHSGKLGCYWLSKQHLDGPERQHVVMPFDLNEPTSHASVTGAAGGGQGPGGGEGEVGAALGLLPPVDLRRLRATCVLNS